MVHYDRCPLCLSDSTHKYLKVKDHLLSGEYYDLFKCSGCGFIFTQDHPDEREIGIYYKSEDYLSHNDKQRSILSTLFRISRNIMLKKKWRMICRYTGLVKGDLLDIGTGSGHFAAFMKKKGWRIKGIEINEKVRKSASSHFGLDIRPPELLKEMASDSYDCITLWHVLEHFPDPYAYISEIRRLLKPGGVCIIALPNCNSSDTLHYGEYWAAWDVPRHLWHFTTKTFRFFAEKTGFSISYTLALPLDVFYIAALSEKYKPSRLYLIPGVLKATWFTIISLFHSGKNSSLVYFLHKEYHQ